MTEVRRFINEPERVGAGDLATAQRLKDVVLDVVRAKVKRVILFGSRARGDASPDSDYDLLGLIENGTREAAAEHRLALYRAFAGFGVNVEPFVMSEEEFEETKSVVGAGLADPAWKEGVVLYEKR